MRAMILKAPQTPLVLENISIPICKDDEILIRVRACGVCRTDVHIQDAELSHPKLPLILGHEIVGNVHAIGKAVTEFRIGDRVGVPWLASSCSRCPYCTEGKENLCDHARYTGYQVNGGFAEYTTCRSSFAIPLPKDTSDAHIAPLLCAGLIGYRAYRKAAPKKTLGLYGFGAAAHILTQLAICEGKEVYAFTREADKKTQTFAREIGAIWAGDTTQSAPILLDAIIIFAPAGNLIPLALRALKKSGRCICGGIHMSDIPSFPYQDLWGEKMIQSVANLTRQDAKEFFALFTKHPIQTHVTIYSLEQANQALDDLRSGKFQGAAVLKIV